MGFIPGARLPLGNVNKDVGSRPRVFIGTGSGVHGADQALLGQFNSAFGKTEYKGLGGSSDRLGQTSFSNYGPVLEARRQARLAAQDPGLSTRGRVGSPGRGARPVGGGLEGRGTRAMPGSRMAPGPMHGPGRAELAAVNRGRAAQRSRVLENLDANRARAGSGAGASRADALAGKRQEQLAGRRQRIMGNIEASRAGRTGGFRRGESLTGMMHGPGRAEYGKIVGDRVRANVATSASVRDARARLAEQRAGARSIRDRMRNTTHTPVSVRPRTPIVAAGETTASGAARGGNMIEKFSRLHRNTKIGIGLGLAVAAGVASNKRGDGASSGRQSNARY